MLELTRTKTVYLVKAKSESEISDWAKASIVYAMEKGFLNRFYENGYFMPKEIATRGQAAVLCYRLGN